ncbi:MAG TPA: hypothetical protein VK789_00615 [Bryobacteraceae bacterium]|jgi:hypothetical protein|nr:hypothetical protein [Bryobacteraceae bacterium]
MRTTRIALLMAAGSCLLPALPPETRHLVTLDVAAVDAAGAPIANLRATDLQVLDNGELRPIALFRHKRDYAAALKNGVELTKDIPINDRIRTLWLVVSDPASNRYGAVLVPWASARRD